MNDQTDSELLRAYAEKRSEAAFSELVRRHVNLIFSAALRMVCDSHLAEDVTQGAFVALAKSAAQLKDRAVLSGWLHRTAQNIAAQTVRTEVRRRVREQEAAAMDKLLSAETHDPAWEEIAPRLDAALGELSETERDAVMLRYFEKKSAQEMAQVLGTSEAAAQKRVRRAVERLRELIAKRGATVGAGGLVIIISAHAVQAAPAGLAATISTASALAGTAVQTSTTFAATKAIAMTTLQKALITATVAVAAGAGIYEARQNSNLRELAQTAQQQQAPLEKQIAQFRQERDEAAAKLEAAQQENERLRQDAAEVPKLRGELARLRSVQPPTGHSKSAGLDPNDPDLQNFLDFKAQAQKIQQYLEKMPDKKIPELHFLEDEDWLIAVKAAKYDTEADVRKTLSKLRGLAKNKMPMGWSLSGYIRAHNGDLPTDLSQLKPYFKTPTNDGSTSHWHGVDPARDDAILDSILARYQLLHTGNIKDLDPNAWLVVEKAPVDKDYDTRGKFGNGFSTQISTGLGEAGDPDDKSY